MNNSNIDIIYGHDLFLVHGVNYVTNMLLHGKSFFEKHDLKLCNIFYSGGVFDCRTNSDIYKNSEISGSQARSYLKRTFIGFLKNSFLYKNSLVELLLVYYRMVRPAKKTISNYCKYRDSKGDYIIFQDSLSAFFYFKYNKDNIRRKTILILHTTEDLYECIKKDRPFFYSNKCMFRWYDKMEQTAISNVDKIVFLSNRAAHGVNSIPDAKKNVIYNGIEEFTFEKMPHSLINLVTVGSVLERKGQRYIIEALNLFTKEDLLKIRLYIVGNGDDYDYCRSLVRQYNLEDYVVFTGLCKDVPDVLKSMDIFILPSASEGLPISIIEALRQGLFVLVTDVGGCKEMINPMMGDIIQRDPKDIKEKLSSILQSRERLLEAGNFSKRMFEKKFTLQMMINNYVNLLKSI